MTARTPSKSPASVRQHENPVPNIEDEIRRRAYELYEERGREDGRDVEDWFRAEEEIKQLSDALLALLFSRLAVACDESKPSQSLG